MVAVAVVACCALPVLIVVGAGALAAAGGAALRYWPLTLVGLAAIAWGAVKLTRLVRARDGALREADDQDLR